MSEMKENVPKIRFPGFTDAWEQHKVSTLSEETYGGGTPKTSIEAYWEGEIPWIQSSDLKEHEVFGVEPNKRISQLGLNNSATKLVPENSIAIITRVGVGKLAFMPFEYATSQDFLSLSKLKVDGWFAAYSLYKKLQSELHSVQGTSIKGITKDELLSKSVMIPVSSAEQTLIGSFFRGLDNLITLHQRKLNNVKNMKASLLQIMFPKDGEDFPEVRFPGFTDAWEQRKLGDLCNEFRSGEFIKATDISPLGEYPVYGGNGIRGYANKYNHDGEFALIGRQGALCGNMQYSYGKSFFTEHAVAVSANNENETRFLYYLFGKMNLGQYSGQSAQPGLAVGKLIELKIMVPIKAEQSKISVLFSKLDNLITLHQRKLEHLQEQKKALLQQMFV